ncbi:MAG: hypothetical protein MAG715_01312 [Methanonatronarchaeales archaeon]|nr:hypothetical protein [Methanonatronarchaeales archaeon]
MMPDPFERRALAVMAGMVLLMLASSYVGTVVLGQDLGGTDAKVEGLAADSAGRSGGVVLDLEAEFGEYGEPAAFTLAGVVSGFLTGLLWPRAFHGGGNVA